MWSIYQGDPYLPLLTMWTKHLSHVSILHCKWSYRDHVHWYNAAIFLKWIKDYRYPCYWTYPIVRFIISLKLICIAITFFYERSIFFIELVFGSRAELKTMYQGKGRTINDLGGGATCCWIFRVVELSFFSRASSCWVFFFPLLPASPPNH